MIHGIEKSISEWGRIYKDRLKDLILEFNDSFIGTSMTTTN